MASRQSHNSKISRGTVVSRRVIVPDRTVRSTGVVAPIINATSEKKVDAPIIKPIAEVKKAVASKPKRRRSLPVSAVHITPQVRSKRVDNQLKQPAPKVKTPPVVDSSSSSRRVKHLARTAHRAQVLSQAYSVPDVKTEGVATKSRKSWKSILLYSAAVILVTMSVYVSVDTWLTNRRVSADVDTPKTVRVEEKESQQTEGRDEQKVTAADLASYSVPAEQPRALYIDKLDIAARIMPMGVNLDNSLQAPQNIFDAGWYTNSIVPSKGGAVVIDGHASGPTRLGLFAYLDTLEQGDQLTIETGDKTRYTYEVVAKETVDRAKIDMKKLTLPYGNAIYGANFITCSGDWQQQDQTYSERTIVYTKLIQ